MIIPMDIYTSKKHLCVPNQYLEDDFIVPCHAE